MGLLYNFGISLYGLVVQIASLFNPKAKMWFEGRRDLFKKLTEAGFDNEEVVWVHCASLGEFEQGRPLIEKLKKEFPNNKILLTFFSPSGYEVRKNYEHADWVFYMPLDTLSNAQQFVNIVNPKIAIFVKYEFWANHFNALNQAAIPIVMVSAIFRPDQRFFKPGGTWFRQTLEKVDHFFVQNDESVSLLNSIGISHATKTGDTRFDRVLDIVSETKAIPMLEKFKDGKKLIILGSSWSEEEEMLASCIEKCNGEVKFIIAPHETDAKHCNRLLGMFEAGTVLFSELNLENAKSKDVLIVNNQGLLSSLYKYADIAIIGGGFGKGIHNILEAATFGMPILFGPKYKKFMEAKDLIQLGGASSFSEKKDLKRKLDSLLQDDDLREDRAEISKKYVIDNTGATHTISKFLKKYL